MLGSEIVLLNAGSSGFFRNQHRGRKHALPSLETGRLSWRPGMSLWFPGYTSCPERGISLIVGEISETECVNEVFLKQRSDILVEMSDIILPSVLFCLIINTAPSLFLPEMLKCIKTVDPKQQSLLIKLGMLL